ncbi:hypothetical protein DFR58_12915 [Anaerobacterium chartisolvens]|uniref:Uncharacterized protein n=1 Tax=Anaerobacterium chartisolvens TaxID=1297424 RepID=A0A369AMZ1_9FIRM|nr:hypothetical protein [Anaerobacterium chartisolvens]RCX10423.1 hypothetical protein DFR58_12915 [Anaerobacterium chartisolvens]
MALRQRYIPPDIREDIKIGGILPIDGLWWIIGSFLLGLMLAFGMKLNIAVSLIVVFILPAALFLIFVLDAYNRVVKCIDFSLTEKKLRELSELCGIQKFDTICRTKSNMHRIFLEADADPWEVCPDAIKEQKANVFSQQVFSVLKTGGTVSVHATSAPESTKQLEERYARLGTYPEGLKDLEDARIAVHYRISRRASSARYIVSIGMRDSEEVSDAAAAFEENAVVIGGDMAEEAVNSHLTPGAKVSRGRM